MLATIGLILFLSGGAVATWAEIAGLCRVRRPELPPHLFLGE